MRTKFIFSVLVVLLCYACPIGGGLAKATDITIAISGTVTSASGSALPSSIHEGTTFNGTYTFNSLVSDSDSDPCRGKYLHNSPYGISISMGGYEFKTAPDHVGQFEMMIMNDDPMGNLWDSYMVFSNENVSIPSIGTTLHNIRWDLADSTHTALSSTALPVTAPVLTEWGYNVLTISGYNNFGISCTVTQAVLIPEPFTGILMALGVFFLRRKR